MKKLFTLVVMMSLLGVNQAKASYLYFTKNVQWTSDKSRTLNYISGDAKGGLHWSGWGDMSMEGNEKDYTWTAKTYGVEITSGSLSGSYSNGVGEYTLYNPNGNAPDGNITISGTGTIIITCSGYNYNINEDLIASYKINVLAEHQKAVWDFNHFPNSVGPRGGYTKWRANEDGDNFSSGITYEGNKTDWDVSRCIQNVNANNANYIADTEGLNIYAYANNLAVKTQEQEYKSLGTTERYVALHKGANFVIPNLEKGDHVRIKMSKIGTGNLKLKFNNGDGTVKDPFGTAINDIYEIGGTAWDDKKKQLEIDYNFFVDDTYFKLEFVDNREASSDWLKIYYIEVIKKNNDYYFTNEIICPDNKKGYTLTLGYEKFYDPSDPNNAVQVNANHATEVECFLHLRGAAAPEGTNHVLELLGQTGNLDADHFTKRGQSHFFLTPNLSNKYFGSYKVRIKAYDVNNKYVTDYAERIMSIGYIDKVDHPKTWDFTDLKNYLNNDNGFDGGYSTFKTLEEAYHESNDLNCWSKDENGDWSFDYDRKNPQGAPFSWGSQLYGGGQMINELVGLGFSPITGDMRNGSITLVDGGMKIEDKNNLAETAYLSRGWELTIHGIDDLAALYLRLAPIPGSNKKPRIEFQYYRSGGGTPICGEHSVYSNYDTESSKAFTSPSGNSSISQFVGTLSASKELVVGHSPLLWDFDDNSADHDIKIILNNVIIKKIGTSKDQKAIGKTGYATECRARAIDHSLTSYFMDLPIHAYAGYLNAADDYSQVVLEKFSDKENTKVLLGSSDGSNGGCILYHAGANQDKSISGLDGGIHLFVPDMHDENKTLDVNKLNGNEGRKNILKSFKPTLNYFFIDDSENYIKPENEGSTDKNLVLSAKKYKYGTNGSDVQEGYNVFFVRVDPNGNGGKGAKLNVNSAYIQIPANKMKELTSSGGSSPAKVSIVFADDFFTPNPGITTSIDDASHLNDNGQMINDKDAEWYNINGQKLNGKPSSGGLYIVNGKKVLVK